MSKKQVLKLEEFLLGSEEERERECGSSSEFSLTGEFPHFDIGFLAPFNYINSQGKWSVLKPWQAVQRSITEGKV